MKCKTCQHEIKREVNFCENCGNCTTEIKELSSKPFDNERGQKLIFAGLMVICGVEIYHALVGVFLNAFGNSEFFNAIEFLSKLVLVVGSSSALLIANGMKNGGLKSIALIFASVYTIIQVYWILRF